MIEYEAGILADALCFGGDAMTIAPYSFDGRGVFHSNDIPYDHVHDTLCSLHGISIIQIIMAMTMTKMDY